jgi:hypothetical protein
VTDSDQDEASAEVPKPTQMLHREQQIGYVMAGVAAAGSVAAATTGHNVLIGALGGGAGVALILAVRYGHRIITAFVGFLAGLALTFFFPLEVAFLIFSGYLMMRTSNAQGKLRRAQGSMTAADRRAAGAARAQAKAAARAARRAGPVPPSATKIPAPNRRYTPPKSKPTRKA